MLEQKEQIRDREISQESLRNRTVMILKLERQFEKKIKYAYICM